MENESTSFWADIKKYEDTLAKDPQSYCFAPLAELYRKLGLVDDAINVAKRGCEIHPEYVGGYLALGRACFDKGLKTEARTAFERVVRVTPDNLLAQKLLSQIYIEDGNAAAAMNALRVILSLNPGDLESQVMLDSLTRTSESVAEPAQELATMSVEEELRVGAADVAVEPVADEALLEDAEIIEELTEEELAEEEPPATVPYTVLAVSEQPEAVHEEAKDPLTTVTLAELYVSQGFLKRALTIYRELVEADPDNLELKQRMVDLKRSIDRDESIARDHALASVAEDLSLALAESSQAAEDVTIRAHASQSALNTLEAWLVNIRRLR